MLHPNYKVKVNSNSFESGKTDEVISIHVNLSMDVPVDTTEVVFRISDNSLQLEEGDDITVSLGHDDDLVDVFTGSIDSMNPSYSEVKITAVSPMWKLTNHRTNEVYEQQNAGQIVSDLASAAEVDTGDVSDGIDLPFYVVDDNKNAYEHVKELAERSGFDIYTTSDGKLSFKEYEKGEGEVAEYGKNVLSIDADYDSTIESVTVFGESPSSTKGSDTWHWLTKDAVQGTAGSGTTLYVTDAAVKDSDNATQVAQAKLDEISRTPILRVEMLGEPNAMLGGTLTVKGMPDSDLNDDYQVRNVEHVFSKVEGFKTILGCCEAADNEQ